MTDRPPAHVVVGLDVGTTGVKAAAFGIDAPWRCVAVREYPLLHPAPGRQVQDPATILLACGAALAECASAAGTAEVAAISVSAGMHGLIALDADLRPLTPLLTWADSRAHEEAASLRRSGRAAALHGQTGVPVHPMTPLTKLMWFARHEPELLSAASWWVGLKEIVLAWLTGTLTTERSSASGTGLLDMATLDWSTEAIAICGVRPDQLAPILPTTGVLALAATAARDVGLPAGVPVVAGAADGPCANLGTGAIAAGIAGLSVGTSGAVRSVVGAPQVDEERTLFCYALTDERWVIGGAMSNGGSIMRWAGGALAADVQAAAGVEGADDAVHALAAGVPAGCDGLVMLPYLLGERAPLWDGDLHGAYLGLGPQHTRAHLVRAALEGVCQQMRVIVDRLDAIEPVHAVHATGGVFRSALWRDVMAAALARPVRVVGDAEGTALGAAALALVGLGQAPTLDDAVVALFHDAEPPLAIDPDPDLVAAYDRQRGLVPDYIAALGGVAGLFATNPAAPRPSPLPPRIGSG
jgi:gluconokinase